MLSRRIVTVALGLYLVVVAWITLNPKPADTKKNAVVEWVLAVCGSVPLLQWVDYAVVEFTANIALFVPMGILLTMLLGRWRWWLALAIGIVATLTIEFTQLFLPARFSDPRDLLANTLGTVIGIALVFAVAAGGGRRSRRARRGRRMRPHGTTAAGRAGAGVP